MTHRSDHISCPKHFLPRQLYEGSCLNDSVPLRVLLKFYNVFCDIPCVSPYLRHRNLTRKIKLSQFPAPLISLGKKSSNKSFRTWNSASKSINKIHFSCFVATEIKHENSENSMGTYGILSYFICLALRISCDLRKWRNC